MNRNIGICGSIINVAAVIGFAVSMLTGFSFGSYFFSMFIALGFVTMTCSYASFLEKERRAAGYASVAFAAAYAAVILLVYFAQLTTVRLDALTPQAAELLDFQRFGLFFNYDLLGYALMALSTFFAGLAIEARSKADRWLKRLLMIHGVFFISCLIVPMLGVFQADDQDVTGVLLLEFWCLYFCPIGILSLLHFLRDGQKKT